MSPRVFVVLHLLLAASPAAAAPRSTEDVQYWAPVILHAPGDRLSGSLELNPRLRGDLGRLNQFIARPGAQWAFTPAFSGAQGYAWVRNDLGSRVLDEHRSWQQLELKALPAAAAAELSLRARLEQRWLEGARGAAWRSRLMARVERPFFASHYLAASNELFVNLTSSRGAPRDGFEQNRFYVGAGRRGAAKRRVEAGYQHWWQRRPSAPDVIFHVLVLTLHWSPR